MYQIQNFSRLHLTPVLTPRIRNLYFLRNVELIFWMTYFQFKLVKYWHFTQVAKIPYFLYLARFTLFTPQFYVWFKRMYLRNTAHFTTNLYKSEIFWFFRTLTHHFEMDSESTAFRRVPRIEGVAVQYYKPVTTTHITFNRKYYINVLMYFLTFILDYYHCLVNTHQTHFNFLLLTPNFRMFKYINKYFFKVYNF